MFKHCPSRPSQGLLAQLCKRMVVGSIPIGGSQTAFSFTDCTACSSLSRVQTLLFTVILLLLLWQTTNQNCRDVCGRAEGQRVEGANYGNLPQRVEGIGLICKIDVCSLASWVPRREGLIALRARVGIEQPVAEACCRDLRWQVNPLRRVPCLFFLPLS